MGCYLAIKKDEIMLFAATRVNLEIIILSEVSQKEKGRTLVFLPETLKKRCPKESGMWLSGEGNGTPLQYSCLENPMDGGAW